MMTVRILSAALFLVVFFTNGLQSDDGFASYMAREPVPLPVWREEVLARGVEFNSLGAPSMALDPSGYPHIVYGDNFLFHTWFDGNSWRTETVDATRTWYNESVLAIDASGTIIIASLKTNVGIGSKQIFVHSLEPAGSWQKTLVPMSGSEGPSLALDSDGWPHIVTTSYSYGRLLTYARQTPTGWAVDVVTTDNIVQGPSSIALDSNNQPAILYEQYISNDVKELWIARLSGDSWLHDRVSRVSSGCMIWGKSLVLDAQDKAHITFSEIIDIYGYNCDRKLTYAHEVDHRWEMSVVTDDGVHPSLALDSTGRPHLAYGAESGQIYAILKGTSWEKAVVQAGQDSGRYNTLVLDDGGVAHIASMETDLHYTTNEGGTWLVSTPAGQEKVGYPHALALSSSDVPHTLYHQNEVEELYWGSGSADQWEAEPIAQVSSTDLELAISVDALDRPHIGYVDGDKDKLITGLRKSGQWSMETISAGGRLLSLATGSDNRPQLIIVQDDALVYWTKHGSDWVSEVVVGSGSGIRRAWLALDSQNWPHIAYSGDGGSFYTFRSSAGNWVAEALPFEMIEGLALGPGDNPFLLHSKVEWCSNKYPLCSYALSVADRDTGGGWRCELFWSDDWVPASDDWYWAGSARLAVDAKNRIHVAMRLTQWGDHYNLRDESGAWLWEYLGFAGGDIGLALGHDNEPRLLTHDSNSLILSTRDFIYLDKFTFLPVVAR